MSRRKSKSPAVSFLPTRRDVLKVLGSGALMAAADCASQGILDAAASSQLGSFKPVAAALAVHPAALTGVRLQSGPFLEAQKRNEAYLLQLEADRMLHNFRVNAGLEPRAPVYGGWESVDTWADIRAHGHTLGHYLTAASLQYASTGHEELKNRVDYIVAQLQECQDKDKSGLVCAFPDKTAQLDNIIAGRRTIGVPWYTMHKIFAGLRDAHLLCANAAARGVLVKLSDWAFEATRTMDDAQFERMLGVEHGGMNEVLADVYALTGDARHLALAERFCHKQLLDPLSQGIDSLDNLHANTQVPKVVGFERLYHLTGQAKYHDAAKFFWKTVTGTRSFATGGHGDNEHFFPVGDFARHLPSAKTMETCCSHNMLRLTRLLFQSESQAAYADYYERALYNTILASQDPDTGMVTYFQSTRPGYLKLYCTPFDSFWCCTGTGIENHAKYGDSIYFLGKSAQRDAVYVNLFIASRFDWKEKGVSLEQETTFPESSRTRLKITSVRPVDVAINIRHPAWAATATIRVNGAALRTSRDAGSWVTLQRQWKTGDVVDVDLPMKLHMELLPGATDTAAAVYGPIVLVGALGGEVKPGDDLHANERTIGSVFTDPVEVPTLSGNLTQIPEKIKPADEPLTFKSQGIGKPNDVTFGPYYKMTHQHYNMYWKVQA